MAHLGFTLNHQRFKKHSLLLVCISMTAALVVRLTSLIIMFIEWDIGLGSETVNFTMLVAQLALFVLYFHALINIRIRYKLINVVIR